MRILLAEKSSFSAIGLQALSEIAPLTALDLSQSQLAEALPGYDILVVRLGLRIDAHILSQAASAAGANRLVAIASPTTGLDHIDLQAAERFGVAVLSLKGERAFLDQVFATAEHTIALMLSLVRSVPAAFTSVQQGEWRRDLFRGRELNGRTLGIIGCGRLGSMVAGYGLAFGMRVVVYDPYQSRLPQGIEIANSLEDLLRQSQVVSLHVPLNGETTGLFDATCFAAMQPGAILVNTARGAVIDEPALLAALNSGKLAGAALDVLADEPPQGFSLALVEWAQRQPNRLIITPHIGGATQESVEKADLFIAGKLADYLQRMRSSGSG